MMHRMLSQLLGRPGIGPRYSRRELLAMGAAAAAGLLSTRLARGGRAVGGKRVIVVGAGFSGLACAFELHAAGYDVQVFEARSRVGGRVLTVRNIAGGKTAEGGGELLGANHPTVLAYAERFGLEFLDVTDSPDDYRQPVLIGGRAPDAAFLERAGEDVDTACAAMTEDARAVDPEQPWKAPGAEALDRRTTANWIAEQPISALARKLLDMQLSGNNSVSVARQSYLGNLAQVRGGGLERYWTESEAYRCKGGNQQFAERLAAALGDRVRLHCPIARIDANEQGASVTDAGGRVWTTDDVVLTVPPSVWHKIAICPPLPEVLKPQMGTAVKYLAVVRERFWEAQRVSPNGSTDGDISFTWHATDGQFAAGVEASADLSVARSAEASTPTAAAVLTAFSSADAALRCRAARNQKERDDLYRGRFTALYPEFRQYVEHGGFYDWVGDPWTQAGYSFPAPGQITAQGPLLRNGVGRLHFAGEHTCYQFVGYMEGGLNSGAALAKRIAQRDGVA